MNAVISKKRNYRNLIVLLNRMNQMINIKDYSGVLHASASILETVAKEVLRAEKHIQNKTFNSLLDEYKKKSILSSDLFEMARKIYIKRNKEPLSGHGSLGESSILKDEAIIIFYVTMMIINIEFNVNIPADTELMFNSPFFNEHYETTNNSNDAKYWIPFVADGEIDNHQYFDITLYKMYKLYYDISTEEQFIVNDKGNHAYLLAGFPGFFVKVKEGQGEEFEQETYTT